MQSAGRIVIATVISALFLFVYDLLVIKPRVEKQRKLAEQRKLLEQKQVKGRFESKEEEQSRKKAEMQEEKKEKEIETRELTEHLTYHEKQGEYREQKAYIEDELIFVSSTYDSIERIELKKFKLKPGSEENFYFSSPFRLFFLSKKKVLKFRVEGEKQEEKVEEGSKGKKSEYIFRIFSDTLTGFVRIRRVENYVFEKDIILYGDIIDIFPFFVIRKSSPETDGELFAGTPKIKNLEKLDTGEKINFFGEKTRYFAFVVFPELDVSFGERRSGKNGEDIYIIRGEHILARGKVEVKLKFFAGPKSEEILSHLNPSAKEIASMGFFSPIAKILIASLKFINSFVGNWGISIIILSVIVRLIFFPLTAISYKSMKKLRDLQPEIEKLKEKYGDDKEKLSREIFELYRREKINPFSGCLPLLIQIPVFIALYQALLNYVDLRHAPFAFWINDLSSPDSLFVVSLGGFEFHFRALPVIMGVTFLAQQLLTPQTMGDQTMKILNYLMPIMFVFILWNIPSGLQLYWIAVNIMGIAQQIITYRKS